MKQALIFPSVWFLSEAEASQPGYSEKGTARRKENSYAMLARDTEVHSEAL